MRFIDSSNADCRNCYKCLRECQVKAISYKNNKATVLENSCILCGRCALVCPQNAQVMVNDFQKLKDILASGEKVVASVAPSFISDFNVESFDVFKEMLLEVGFSDAIETIVGARVVNKEYEKILENGQEIVVSTCCPVVINYVTKYYPSLVKYLAPVVSPMVAHGKIIKSMDETAKVVFIGPCLAKKDEMNWEENIIDLVVTFQELKQLFDAEGLELPKFPEIVHTTDEYSKIRLYPTSGGIIKSFQKRFDEVTYVNIDGLENVKSFLDELLKGNYSHTFVELSACNGSCLGGPCKINQGNYLECITRLKDYVRKRPKSDFYPLKGEFDLQREFVPNSVNNLVPSDYEIRQILKQIGKDNSSQELNCGACGYPTCREKAAAVYNGKAVLSMCLPFMKERAESLSWEIINNSPNAIISFDGDLNLQRINPKAYEYFGIPKVLSLEEIQMQDYLDLYDFQLLVSSGKDNQISKKFYISQVNKHIDGSLVYVRELDLILGVFKDITEDEEKEKFLQGVRKNTVDVANELIDKQMRSVQEIASLLGETVAETKIALTNLKKVMDDSNDN